LSGHVSVGDHTIISGYTLVHQFSRIGEYVMIGGGARITKDVPPYMKALYESECVSYNSLGLRRSGVFSQEEVHEVREAFRILFRSGLPLGKAAAQLAERAKTRTGQRILEFVNGPSRLGIVGGRVRLNSRRPGAGQAVPSGHEAGRETESS
jgi:UDP-N-acetylglucosamine acyltransferase